ncbi:MAG TPA: cytidine deaminase [Sphingobacteriaceae bacterium]|nr:cytidine deaminase [Sphingobacteriaceae bacterium]
MINKEITINYEEYSGIDELPDQYKELCLEAENALNSSHSPYSKFRVGAALRLKSGRIVYGSNQENVAYPSGLCAERVALFTAGANYPEDPIIAMAVTAQTDLFKLTSPVTSCGSCLQVMVESEKKQNSPFDIILHCIDGPVIKTRGVKSFMPFLFDEGRLEK